MPLQIDLNITVWVILIKDFHLTFWIIFFNFFDKLANSRKYRSHDRIEINETQEWIRWASLQLCE